jgi:hypothetical protein
MGAFIAVLLEISCRRQGLARSLARGTLTGRKLG